MSSKDAAKNLGDNLHHDFSGGALLGALKEASLAHELRLERVTQCLEMMLIMR